MAKNRQLSTPRSTPRRKPGFTASLARNVARAVASSTPSGRAALGVYRAAGVARRLFTPKKKRMSAPRSIKGQSYTSGRRVRGGSKKGTKFDKISQNGFVSKTQVGAVMTTLRPVGYLAQSTMPRDTVVVTVLKSMVKKLLNEAGLRIKNENETLLDGQYYNSTLEFRYKIRDGNPVASKTFTIDSATTLATLCDRTTAGSIGEWLMNQFGELLPTQWLTLRYYVEFATFGTARMIQGELDLTAVTVHVQSQSLLKMQNRTINSTGNNEADDVDNVPLDGKWFEYNSNGTIYQDYNTPAADGKSQVMTQKDYGILPTTLASETGTSMYADIPLKSQFIGCKTNGNWSIQPATIRESLISSSLSMNFSKFIQTCCRAQSYNVQFVQYWIGKTRLFAMEKKIFAASSDAVSQIAVAFDHELTIGAHITERKTNQTAPRVFNVPNVVV